MRQKKRGQTGGLRSGGGLKKRTGMNLNSWGAALGRTTREMKSKMGSTTSGSGRKTKTRTRSGRIPPETQLRERGWVVVRFMMTSLY
jgi:hypothetical protein